MTEKQFVINTLGEETYLIGEYSYQNYIWGKVVCGNADRSNPMADVGVYVVFIMYNNILMNGFCTENYGTDVKIIDDNTFIINGELHHNIEY